MKFFVKFSFISCRMNLFIKLGATVLVWNYNALITMQQTKNDNQVHALPKFWLVWDTDYVFFHPIEHFGKSSLAWSFAKFDKVSSTLKKPIFENLTNCLKLRSLQNTNFSRSSRVFFVYHRSRTWPFRRELQKIPSIPNLKDTNMQRIRHKNTWAYLCKNHRKPFVRFRSQILSTFPRYFLRDWKFPRAQGVTRRHCNSWPCLASDRPLESL